MNDIQLQACLIAALVKRLGGHAEFSVDEMAAMHGFVVLTGIKKDMSVVLDIVPMRAEKEKDGYSFN